MTPNRKFVFFYSAHGTFSAGVDLHEIAKFDEQKAGYSSPHISQTKHVNGRNIGPIGPSQMQIQKPVINAVSGYTVAGGLELSLLGDI